MQFVSCHRESQHLTPAAPPRYIPYQSKGNNCLFRGGDAAKNHALSSIVPNLSLDLFKEVLDPKTMSFAHIVIYCDMGVLSIQSLAGN